MMLRAYNRELAAIRSRSRVTYGISLGAHVVLLVCLILQRQLAPEEDSLTEITWIEKPLPQPVAVAAAAVPAPPAPVAVDPTPAPEPRQEPAQPTPAPEPKQHFAREMRRGDSAPEPQSAEVVHDKLNERLASLKRGSTVKSPPIATPVTASTLPSMSLAVPVDDRARSAPASLNRGQSEKRAPAPLHRSSTPTPTVSRATISTPTASSAPLPARIDSTLQRTVAGASLIGPVADRPLESFEKPKYPAWAQRDAVEASVSLFFKVMTDGRIKEPVLVQKTSGHRDFDRNAIAALSAWRFAPLEGGGAGEQWGEITFHYRLHDTVDH
jgi:TonB family protein